MTQLAAAETVPELRRRVDEHLGADCTKLPIVSESYPSYEHVNMDLALSRYLERDGCEHELIGLSGMHWHHASLADLLGSGRYFGVRLGTADFTNLPVGPEETRACTRNAVFLIDDRGTRLCALLRLEEQGSEPVVSIDVIATDPEKSRAVISEVRRLMIEVNVLSRPGPVARQIRARLALDRPHRVPRPPRHRQGRFRVCRRASSTRSRGRYWASRSTATGSGPAAST